MKSYSQKKPRMNFTEKFRYYFSTRGLSYIFYLALKKSKTKIHNKLEKKIKSESSINLDNFISFLIKEVYKNLVLNDKGIFFKTKISNNNKPVIVAQGRLISLLCDGYYKENFPVKDKNLIKELSNYLLTLKNGNNIYEFNNSKRETQDEGIGSVWSAIALIKTYEILGEQLYLNESIAACKAMIKNLYSSEIGLVHTAGQDYWCVNASSKFAYLCSLVLKYNHSDDIEKAMVNSIKICTDKIMEDGHFPYNGIYSDVYILLYHPSVMFYLEKCLASKYLCEEIKSKIIEVNKSAFSFLYKCLDNSGRFNEPDTKEYNFYIITTVTALAAISGKIEKSLENKVFDNILKYYNDNKLYLFIDKNDYLSFGSMYKYKDSFIVETLYWMVQCLYSDN